jgi:hypothetical protein
MNKFATLQAAVDKCSAATCLTAKQMENAMINMDRMVDSFGRSHHEFMILEKIENNCQVMQPVTHEQFMAYVNHKREMLAQHSYLLGV